ncbi:MULTISPECIES: P1 family peptidase [Bosea]|uniref:DmpA family aminopeptidase n=1 Tax=Bosea TaxID=85413 RepID=UPI002150343E|nr:MULTISPECIES: P1 family peptidase [Bosea]MCR4522418.1 P1 family peptidase [Bosea sp. 47.2.35]MDR6829113.1 D-aminopeptidase [Bosea robiniae]MDR6895997.1 D-aminopeptidase [Bosea sp. BE109]MDR7139394.1 D-aminopeptidase [Bosea sp. BE168]MDR7176092.1 D-aminopeptidase [Bosea sp. BE271]
MTQRLRDFDLTCGILQPGPLNAITDVPGVKLGHFTLNEGDLRTGFTALLPHDGNLFRRKVRAAVDVINGFGKSAGLMQLAELGQIETPLLLGNTLSVGTGFDALVTRALADNPDIGRETGTVNPVVLECNDGYLSDIRARALTEAHAFVALDAAASGPVAEGAAGAGTGMSAFGFKGGIGTASRHFDLDDSDHTLGVLALANFGNSGDLVLPDGRRPVPPEVKPQSERGSVILVIATDVPLESRQLHRIARRGGAGLARLGAFWGNGSGDIAVAFTTACPVDHDQPNDLVPLCALNENRIDTLFRAAAEATQEAVLNAMVAAPATTGRDGHHRPSLGDWLRANAG